LTPPELADFKPTGTGEPPLARATDWVQYRPLHHERGSEGTSNTFPLPSLGLIEGSESPIAGGTRETNTMPQWAGSCWYYLRYCDARNDARHVGEDAEKYWMQSNGKPGGVDLYVGGTEHAVLHLLYARFWHRSCLTSGT
jgi:leucyl-tRNA synthetase